MLTLMPCIKRLCTLYDIPLIAFISENIIIKKILYYVRKKPITSIFLLFFLFLFVQHLFKSSTNCQDVLPKEKLITSSFDFLCGGLGNQMYRFASLYGIGLKIGRKPYFELKVRCMLSAVKEAEDVFPEYAQLLRFERIPDNMRTLIKFGDHCCKYDNVQRLMDYSGERYIQLSANHLQSYHYFEDISEEIRRIFTFARPLKQKVQKFAKKLFGNDTSSHKLCAYTRRGDFIEYNTESKTDFTEKSIRYATKVLKQKFGRISLILLGEDQEFLRNITIDRNITYAIHLPESKTRGEDLCFAVNHCNSLLLTVPSSTFGWWIGFLMNIKTATITQPASGYIFYNSNFYLEDIFHGYRNYFPDWIPLKMTSSGSIIEL